MKLGITSALLLALGSGVQAASINVNLSVYPVVDQQVVDPGETSVVGILGAEAVDGSGWNNINLRNAGSSGAPTFFTDATQGGNRIDLIGSSGGPSGVEMTSSGAFFANFANVSGGGTDSAVSGDAGLMQGYVLTNSSETITLSGLASWAPNGYVVYAMFDIGPAGPRTYGIKVTDGSTSQSFWTADTDSDVVGGFDTDVNNDGIIEWKETTATTSGTAVTDANYARFGTFTGDTMTISGADATRAVLSGFQIVAVPEPSTGALVSLLVLGALAKRRR